MQTEREYYIAEGEDLAKANAFIEERQQALKLMDAVAKKYNGEAVHNSRCLLGLVMPERPDGWTKKGTIEGKPYYMPKRTSKALKAIHEDLRGVRIKGASEFHGLFCRDGGRMVEREDGGFGMRILYTVWEWVGDTLLLSVPVGSDFTPNGSRKLKMSEYWALKEQEPKP